jgi:hypothetical protein
MPLLGNHVLLILGYHVNREIGFRATDAGLRFKQNCVGFLRGNTGEYEVF